MSEMVIRIAIVAVIGLLTWLLVHFGRRFVETRRQRALAATPLVIEQVGDKSQNTHSAHVRILAFSSEDCHQCHTLQKPALQRIVEQRGETVAILDIDAPGEQELTQRYQVLTVPTTVILDATGKAHAINYGFASTQRLLTQVDAALAGNESL